MTGIYQITNKINGNSYVGQSVNIERRFMEHRTPHGSMNSIKLAIRKYGVANFTFSVIEQCEVEELNDKERYWIAKLKPKYNRTSGGEGCKDHAITPEAREVLSEKNKQYWQSLPQEKKAEICKRLVGPGKGHAVSEETKEKLRAANIGKKMPDDVKAKRAATILAKKQNGWVKDGSGTFKKVICLDSGETFESVKAAAKNFGIGASSVTAVLKGRQKSTHGKHFSYVV